MGVEKYVPRTEADWDDWEKERYVRKEPLKRELLKAKARWDELLGRVIGDGETVIINGDEGQPVAAMVPYAEFIRMEQR